MSYGDMYFNQLAPIEKRRYLDEHFGTEVDSLTIIFAIFGTLFTMAHLIELLNWCKPKNRSKKNKGKEANNT